MFISVCLLLQASKKSKLSIGYTWAAARNVMTWWRQARSLIHPGTRSRCAWSYYRSIHMWFPHTYVMELERTPYGRAGHPCFRTVVLAWFSICSRIRGNAYVHIFLGSQARTRLPRTCLLWVVAPYPVWIRRPQHFEVSSLTIV